jgi:adenylylsulfate kinase
MKNTFPVESTISIDERCLMMGQKSCVVWFTGLSGSGKSTLAGLLEAYLFESGYKPYLLDSDTIRNGLNKDLLFSDDDRKENVRRLGEVSKLMADAGLIVVAASISPFKSDRDEIKKIIGEQRFVEIFVDCPLQICEQRDVKGLYKKARQGLIKQFTGVDSLYEKPLNPSVTIHSDTESINSSFQKVVDFVTGKIKM